MHFVLDLYVVYFSMYIATRSFIVKCGSISDGDIVLLTVLPIASIPKPE